MDDYVYLRVTRPEGYEDVHPDLILDDLHIADGWVVEVVADPEPPEALPEDWRVAMGDSASRLEPGSGLRVNSSGAWAVGPFRRSTLDARRDIPQPAPLEEAVREALASFGAVMLREFWQDGNPGDIDGGAAQEAAEESGLWHQVERHADGVECEWCGNYGPCGEMTDVGLAALARGEKGEK